jgi:hypothetical protein
VEFHVHTDVAFLIVGAMLSQNVIRKNDQPIMYASRLLNITKQNYNTTQKEASNGFFFTQVQTLFFGQ